MLYSVSVCKLGTPNVLMRHVMPQVTLKNKKTRRSLWNLWAVQYRWTKKGQEVDRVVLLSVCVCVYKY